MDKKGDKYNMNKFSADDRGNVVYFYEKMEDGTWESAGRLYRESGENANTLCWLNESGEELEQWAEANGYAEEISEGKKYKEQEMKRNNRSDPKKEADKLRQEANDLLNRLFCDVLKLSHLYKISGVDRLVDCIISAAVLEIADIHKQVVTPKQESVIDESQSAATIPIEKNSKVYHSISENS